MNDGYFANGFLRCNCLSTMCEHGREAAQGLMRSYLEERGRDSSVIADGDLSKEWNKETRKELIEQGKWKPEWDRGETP